MRTTQSKQHRRRKLLLHVAAASLLCLFASPPAIAQEKLPIIETKRFDLSVKDMEITELLKMMAASNRLSIVCSSDVAGKVSVNFFDVTLDEALDAILSVNGLTFTRRGKVIHVHKPPEKAVEMISRSFVLKWADPSSVVEVLTELKGEEGSVVRSKDSVVVVVRDIPSMVEQMAEVIGTLDRKPRQVLITTWIVEVSDQDIKKLGVNWQSLNSLKIFEFAGEASYNRVQSNTNTGTDFTKAVGTVVDMRAGVLSSNQFSLLMSFYETLEKTKVVSAPRVMTLENRPASIVVGEIYPIPLYDFAKETGVRILGGYQEQKIGKEVTVTPRVHSDSYITLVIAPKVEEVTGWVVVNGEKERPIVGTREAKTTVMVKSGDIVVIGGLRGESRTLVESRVPLLHKIPLIGPLFKFKEDTRRTTDITIFIKPELFDEDNPLSLEEREVFGSIKPAKAERPDAVAGPKEE